MSSAASIRDRLKQLAQTKGDDFQVVLSRYVVERFLFRLSYSNFADRFIVKGASLFYVWLPDVSYFRVTRDLDLLGRGKLSEEDLRAIVTELCRLDVDDGLVFDPGSVTTRAIRPDDKYGGTRVTVLTNLLKIRIPLQIDVGLGDSVSPPSVLSEFPTLLAQDPPRLQIYQRETALAEKFHALVERGLLNSRLKDYFDTAILARSFSFNAQTLWEAIYKTFERRGTPVPTSLPPALSERFLEVSKQAQWKAFVKKRLRSEHKEWLLDDVVSETRNFLWPVLEEQGRLEAIWGPEELKWLNSEDT